MDTRFFIFKPKCMELLQTWSSPRDNTSIWVPSPSKIHRTVAEPNSQRKKTTINNNHTQGGVLEEEAGDGRQ